MALTPFRFLARLGVPSPNNAAIAQGDRVDEALDKLQGQINNRLGTAGGTLSGDLAMSGNDISGAKTIGFNGEYDNGNSGSSTTVTLVNGQKQKIVLNAATPTVFIDPASAAVGHYQLRIIQDATGGRVPSWGGTLSSSRWLGSATAHSVNTAANGESILTMFWDGTNLTQSISKVGAA